MTQYDTSIGGNMSHLFRALARVGLMGSFKPINVRAALTNNLYL